MPATYPAVAVSWAPSIAPNTIPAPGDWVDITSDVVSDWSVKWGRFDEFSEAGAGTASLTLKNNTGAWDPDNSGGPNYGDLVAGAWFRIKAGTTTANTDVFYGHVSDEGFQISASQYPDSYVRVDLVDDMEQLANTILPSSVWWIEVDADSPEGWWRLGEASGTQATDSSGNQRHLTYFEGATFNSRASLIEGEDDTAIYFDDAAGQYAQGDFIPEVSLGTHTWEFVVQGSGAVIGTAVYAEGASAGAFIAISINFNSGNVTVDWSDDAGNFDSSNTIGSGINVADGEPHVIAFCYETTTGDLRLFIDGIDRTITSASRAGKTLSLRRLRLGGGGFTATLDDVVLYTADVSTSLPAHYEAATAPWEGELSSDRIGHLLDAVSYDA